MSDTILFHGPNRVGIGHINRLSSIARAVQNLDSSVKTPFLIEGTNPLLDAYNLPYLSLPLDEAMFINDAWTQWEPVARLKVQLDLCRAALRTLKPSLVVVDCFSTFAIACALMESDVLSALCLRRMKDMDDYVARMGRTINRAKLILIPHEPDEFSIPAAIQEKSCYVGGVVQPHVAAYIKNHRPGNSRQILVTGGGGGYKGTLEFYNMTLGALREVRKERPSLEICLIAGPQFTEWMSLQVGEGVRIVPFEEDMTRRFCESQLVICQAGYNTIAELRQLNVKTICVPAERPADDQFGRANEFARECPNISVFCGSNEEELGRLIKNSLDRETVHKPTPPVAANGGQVAAEKLLALCKLPRMAVNPVDFSTVPYEEKVRDYIKRLNLVHKKPPRPSRNPAGELLRP